LFRRILPLGIQQGDAWLVKNPAQLNVSICNAQIKMKSAKSSLSAYDLADFFWPFSHKVHSFVKFLLITFGVLNNTYYLCTRKDR
jgi:hypothetical protein